jgi:hypothetical protein
VGRICACTVSFRDRRGFKHSTEVRASSVYEAACRAWARFKSSGETEEESYKTEEFIVEVSDDPKIFHVNLDKMLTWLGRGRRGRNDSWDKQRLRKLLDEK